VYWSHVLLRGINSSGIGRLYALRSNRVVLADMHQPDCDLLCSVSFERRRVASMRIEAEGSETSSDGECEVPVTSYVIATDCGTHLPTAANSTDDSR